MRNKAHGAACLFINYLFLFWGCANRGKCSVALLNETEVVLSYLEKEVQFYFKCCFESEVELISHLSKLLSAAFALFLSQDTFFYSLVYDPTQKTLLADKGEIRVGPRFQADVPEMLQEG